MGSAGSTRDSGGPEASASSTDLAGTANERIREFATAILHGDPAHKAWLLAAAEAFIAGKRVPKPPAKPQLTGEEIVKRYAPQGACIQCDRRRKADGYWPPDRNLRAATVSLETTELRVWRRQYPLLDVTAPEIERRKPKRPTGPRIAYWYAPEGTCPHCDRRRKRDGYFRAKQFGPNRPILRHQARSLVALARSHSS